MQASTLTLVPSRILARTGPTPSALRVLTLDYDLARLTLLVVCHRQHNGKFRVPQRSRQYRRMEPFAVLLLIQVATASSIIHKCRIKGHMAKVRCSRAFIVVGTDPMSKALTRGHTSTQHRTSTHIHCSRSPTMSLTLHNKAVPILLRRLLRIFLLGINSVITEPVGTPMLWSRVEMANRSS